MHAGGGWNLIQKSYQIWKFIQTYKFIYVRAESRAAATSKMERFVIIVNGWKPLTIITKRSILDVSAALDPPLYVQQP